MAMAMGGHYFGNQFDLDSDFGQLEITKIKNHIEKSPPGPK
jgi:hypothetical protein